MPAFITRILQLRRRIPLHALLALPVLAYLAVPVIWRDHDIYVITGDEPHYLLVAESMVRDHDLRVLNNYQSETTPVQRKLRMKLGILIVTTPNVVRLENVRRVIAGENIYDPYSGYGPYGRHNREYTTENLFALLSANGFSVRTMFTADVHPESEGPVSLTEIAPLVKNRPTNLGQYIFCQCSINQESKNILPARPDWLYRSRQDLTA